MKYALVLLTLLASAANAQTLSKKADTPEDLITAQKLIERHFSFFNQTDANKRFKQYAEVYAPDFFMGDYGGGATGVKELNALLTRIQSGHPGFEFQPDKVILNHGLGRVTWWYGPKENPHTVRGEDVFTVANGKLSTLRVFIDAEAGGKK